MLAIAGGGCAGPLAFEFGSASIGTHADGTLRHPTQLPFDGDGYTVPGPWRARRANYATEELVGAVVRAARAVARSDPGGVAAIGDLSRRAGGGSAEHKSHQSGRDVDVFFYGVERDGRPVLPGDSMLHFAPDGRAIRWSPPHGVRAPAGAGPGGALRCAAQLGVRSRAAQRSRKRGAVDLHPSRARGGVARTRRRRRAMTRRWWRAHRSS